MITKLQFNNLLKSPKKHMNNIEISEFDKLKNQFPYCEIIYNISLIKSHLTNDINFSDKLTITSLYSSNRQHLFTLVHGALKVPNKKTNNTEKLNLFEDWLKNPLLIKDSEQQKKNIVKNIKKSTQDNDYLTTETLAKLYAEQGHYERAIQAYKILCLKYPKKSSFFANRIKEIEILIN